MTILDVDPPHLEAAARQARNLPADAGNVFTVVGDVTKDADLAKQKGQDYDALLVAAFLYLAPPPTAKAIFCRAASLVRPGGLAVVQFSTNIVRRAQDNRPLFGEHEYRYTLDEGRRVLNEMYAEASFEQPELVTSTVGQDEPFYMRAEALFASGTRKTA